MAKKGWHESGAHTPSKFPGHKCMSSKRGNEMGSKATGFAGHGRVSSEHGTGDRGRHHQLHNAEGALGSGKGTFKNTLTKKAGKKSD